MVLGLEQIMATGNRLRSIWVEVSCKRWNSEPSKEENVGLVCRGMEVCENCPVCACV